MAHRVILSTVDVRNFDDDTQHTIVSTDYPFCNLGDANDGGDYLFGGITISDITNDVDFGDIQTIKVKFTINGSNSKQLAQNITKIQDILNDTQRYYSNIMKRSSTRADNVGHGSNLGNAYSTGAGFDASLYSVASATGILSVKPDGLDDTACFDILYGELHLPSNYLNITWGSRKIIGCELEIAVKAGGRGTRREYWQKIVEGNFENSDNSNKNGWSWDNDKFNVLSSSPTFNAKYPAPVYPLQGKFGTKFLEYRNDNAFLPLDPLSVNHVVTPAIAYNPSGNSFKINGPNDNVNKQALDLFYTPSFWVYWYDTSFAAGYFTAFVEYYLIDIASGIGTWTVDQQIMFVPSGSVVPSQRWVEYVGKRKSFTFPNNGTNQITQYRIRFEITACSNNVVNGFTGLAIDGVGFNVDYNGLPGEAYVPYTGEYFAKCFDKSYNLYGVAGDLPTKLRAKAADTLNYGASGGISYLTLFHNRGKYTEAPLPVFANPTGVVSGVPFDGNISTAGYGGVENIKGSYFKSNLIDSNVNRRTFYINTNADRVPRNYYALMIYASVSDITETTLTIGGEKQIFNTPLPASGGDGSTYFTIGILGEYQFPQPNQSNEDYAQTVLQQGRLKDTLSVELNVNDSNFFTLAGLIFLPTDYFSSLDTFGINSISLNNLVGTLIFSSESKLPSASLQLMSLNYAPDNKIPPIPITSFADTADYVGGDFEMLPNIRNEYFREYEQFNTLVLTYSGVTFYGFNTQGLDLAVEYTPKWKYATPTYAVGSGLDDTSPSYANYLSNFNGVPANIPSGWVTSVTSTVASGNDVSVVFTVANSANLQPTHFLIERYTNFDGPQFSAKTGNLQNYKTVGIVPFTATGTFTFHDYLAVNGTYQYRVRAVNAYGSDVKASSSSAIVAASLPVSPLNPRVIAFASSKNPTIQWNDGNAGIYLQHRIQRRVIGASNNSWVDLGTVLKTAVPNNKFTDTTVTNNVAYEYRIRAETSASGTQAGPYTSDTYDRQTTITTPSTAGQQDSITKMNLARVDAVFTAKSAKSWSNVAFTNIKVRNNSNLGAGDAEKWANLERQILDYLSVNKASLNTSGVIDTYGFPADISGNPNNLLAYAVKYPYGALSAGNNANAVMYPAAFVGEEYKNFTNLIVAPIVSGQEQNPPLYEANSTPVYELTSPFTIAPIPYLFTRRFYQYIKIMVRWEILQPTLGSAFNATALSDLTTIVNAVANSGAGPKAIISLSNNDEYNGTSLTVSGATPNSSSLQNFWGRISDAFKTNANVYAYELMNEPTGLAADATPRTPAQVHEKLMQDVVTYLRGTKTDTRKLLVPLYNKADWIAGLTAHTTNFITDTASNFAYAVHASFDGDSSGNYSKSYSDENIAAAALGY